jgi:hypothetical protein
MSGKNPFCLEFDEDLLGLKENPDRPAPKFGAGFETEVITMNSVEEGDDPPLL